MAFTGAISVLPRPARLNSSTPVAMASVAALPRPPPLLVPRIRLSAPLPLSQQLPPLLEQGLRHPKRLDPCARLQYPACQRTRIHLPYHSRPLGCSDPPQLIRDPRALQYVLTRVPAKEERTPAFMSICSPPRLGNQIQLLVRSVPNTTSELLCKRKRGDIVHLGPIGGQGFSHPVQNLNPPEAAKTVVLIAAEEGISPIRALIKYGFAAKERDTVKLYYGASSSDAMPLRDEISGWQDTGVTVREVIGESVQLPFIEELSRIIVNPDSTAAILVGPREMEEEVVGILRP